MAFLWRNAVWVVAGLSALSLVAAYVAEYGFGLQPCELCLKQRIPFYLVIGLSLASLLRNSPAIRTTVLALMALALLINATIALYHSGVEQKWWPGPTACSGDQLSATSFEDLREQIMSAPVVRCDEPALEVYGITMASANMVFSLALAVFALVALFKQYSIASLPGSSGKSMKNKVDYPDKSGNDEKG